MKLTIWTLGSALPEGNTVRPTHPDVFTDEAAARRAYAKAMAEEWTGANQPCDGDGEPLPMPDDPDEAHEALVQSFAGFDVDEPWGEWRLSRHDVDVQLPVFIVAYDGDDGAPYACAFSTYDKAQSFANSKGRHRGVIQSTIDCHVGLELPDDDDNALYGDLPDNASASNRP